MSIERVPERKAVLGASAVLAGGAILAQTWFMGWAVVGLDVALVVSYALWASRPAPVLPARVLPVLIAACVVQVAHLTEEYRTGFQRAFPALFGYAWEDRRFLTFNLVWLAVFAASAVAIARRQRLGSLPALFLALGGGIANGLAHLVLAARAGGYFPGAYTAPLCFVAGLLLLRRLLERPAGDPSRTERG